MQHKIVEAKGRELFGTTKAEHRMVEVDGDGRGIRIVLV
jgi:hypothetical protein